MINDSALHAMTGFLSSNYLEVRVISYETWDIERGLQFTSSNLRTLHDRGHLAKTIFNIVMALSTLPELHLIILYLLTYFFLKSNSREPFFQAVILVSTYRSL